MKLKFLTILAGSSLLLSSCLKEKGFLDLAEDKGQVVSEIAEATVAEENSLALEPTPPTETTDAFTVRLGSRDLPSQSYTVKITPNNTLVADYNSAHGTSLVVPTSAQVSFPNTDVAVGSGSRKAGFKMTVNKNLLDFSLTYGMGFTISEANGTVINANARNIVVILGVKNKYDGVYQFRGRVEVQPDRPATFFAGAFTYGSDIHLITAGPKSVKMVNTAFGTSGFHPLINNNATSGFGSTQPWYDFDGSDNLVAVDNIFPNPSNGRDFIMNSAITNSRYDNATKTIFAAMIMTQPGFAPMPLWDTMTFQHPR